MSGIKLTTQEINIDDGINLEKGTIKFKADLHGAVSGGTNDYEKIINHPFINDEEVVGKKTAKQYNLQELLEAITEQDIDEIMFGGE